MAGTSAAHDLTSERAAAEEIFRRAVAAADPAAAVVAALDQRQETLGQARGIILVAFGKAAIEMAEAAMPRLGDRLTRAVIVTTPQAARPVAGAEVIAGNHPTPDEGSERGAAAIEAAAESAGADDLVLVLVSGGGSALVTAPAEGLTLADKIAVNDALLACGAPIGEVNTVRRRLSRLKGGGLLARAAPARVLSLILSDVPGDDPRAVASGPSVPSADAPDAALKIVERYGITARLPDVALARIRDMRPADQSVLAEHETVIVGSNDLSCREAAAAAAEAGYQVERLDGWLEGDVAAVADRLHSLAATHAARRSPVAIIAGGESTVILRGNGKGGRNQEMALRFALLDEAAPIGCPWVFLSGGTDGRDGPTDAAGALVDPGSLARMRAIGLSPIEHLERNDSHPVLAASGDLVMTGATGTNVADVQIVLLR